MFEVGAEYNRRRDIHAVFGGQQQGGISTPSRHPFIFLFTGEAGEKHGYHDEWAEDGFHMYGEGQVGPMTYTGGNRALRDHLQKGYRVFLFQATGKSMPCVYRGEFAVARHYVKADVPDTEGDLRPAIIFVLARVAGDQATALQRAVQDIDLLGISLNDTSRLAVAELRTKQTLFRDRLELIEKRCRVTGISDGRFLRASHIKPWSACTSGDERVDGSNGLLLSYHADHLFDRGWITFLPDGTMLTSPLMPTPILERLHLTSTDPRPVRFTQRQAGYLKYHYDHIFLKEPDDRTVK
ncbi:HNH endonuclease signature motif containing protein [Luteibacter sp. PPL201]|uniref:HNH endonuclease signature motif containing protein n=1 Tax=Luteibacter sahnii TaxID=3021977 RepID=A0ABT6B9G9_9GAMM